MPRLSTRIKAESFHRRFTTMLHPPPEGTLCLTERDYEYEHELPLAQEDPVYHMILVFLSQLEKEDIGVAAARMVVWNTSTSPPIWPPRPRNPDSKFYTFKEWYQEFPITVPITIAQGVEYNLTADDLRVLYQGRLVPLRTWLLDIPDRRKLLSKRHGIQSQQTWWRKNRKVFRLFDLPSELRILIYQHVIGPVYPTTASSPDLNVSKQPRLIILGGLEHKSLPKECKSLTRQGHLTITAPKIKPNLSILRVNSHLRNEALQAVWQNTRKYFFEVHMFTNVVKARQGPGSASSFNCFSHIQLDFTLYRYFAFFGVDCVTLGQNLDSADCRYLALLPQLRDLQLRFRYSTEHYENAAWDSMNGCQQVYINRLLTFAFPVLLRLQRVTFVGNIRTDVKYKWETRLKQRKGQPELFDHEEQLDEICNAPNRFQLPLCSLGCGCNETTTDYGSY